MAYTMKWLDKSGSLRLLARRNPFVAHTGCRLCTLHISSQKFLKQGHSFAIVRKGQTLESGYTKQYRCYASSQQQTPFAHENTAGRNVIDLLRSRGLVQDIANEELQTVAGKEKLKLYLGFDPTASSLHIGHLLGIVVLKWFQKCGHQVVPLLGGATGRVGDPSGRSAERPILSVDEIKANVSSLQSTLERLLSSDDNDGPKPDFKNNLDWFEKMDFLSFLREVGKFARVNVMLSRESVKQRLDRDEGISFTEFTYQLLQGYDFYHMHKSSGVTLQIGGSDQMGNILAGMDLIRRKADSQNPTFGLVFPLLTTSEGVKMGKSAGGAIWLDPNQLSPFKFYQYLLTNTSDADVIRFLKMLTFISLEQLNALEYEMSEADYKPNTAQKLLAAEVTRFVHGEEGLKQAESATQALAPGGSTELNASALEAIAEEAPSARLPRDQVISALLSEIMATVKLQASKSASRRLIQGGGVRVNNEKISDVEYRLEEKDLIEGRLVLIAAGKKNKLLLHVE